MNALSPTISLKNLRRILRNVPRIRFGRYINVEVTPPLERNARRLHPEAPANEVVFARGLPDQPAAHSRDQLCDAGVSASPAWMTAPCSRGPWRFLVVDEAHLYGGQGERRVAAAAAPG